VRVEGIEEMFDLCHGLSQCPILKACVAIVDNSGGPDPGRRQGGTPGLMWLNLPKRSRGELKPRPFPSFT